MSTLTKKLYDNDSYLREFTAKVLSCEPLPDAKKQIGRAHV